MVIKVQAVQSLTNIGTLAGNMNADLSSLREILKRERGTVHGYVVTTIKYRQGKFIQTGSGPNFEGGAITLCTCKHQMRSRLTLADWLGAWVAGFTSLGEVAEDHLNHLVFLMKVGEAYASHRDLWAALSITERRAKAVDANALGDVFQPRIPVGDWFDPDSYSPPGPDHSHCPNNIWRDDIDYVRSGRRPPLLVGDRDLSFVWNRPRIAWPPPRIARDYERHPLSEFLARLT